MNRSGVIGVLKELLAEGSACQCVESYRCLACRSRSAIAFLESNIIIPPVGIQPTGWTLIGRAPLRPGPVDAFCPFEDLEGDEVLRVRPVVESTES